ncbi:hypothetical protein ADL01_16780, partial [Streptomyces sp. NRRL WC-3618]|uniref:hypothetical protein n=1 Tax=Streptomyces sp. NRRL WC-3618 TaxID=1519490 RepID=UPI0006C133CB
MYRHGATESGGDVEVEFTGRLVRGWSPSRSSGGVPDVVIGYQLAITNRTTFTEYDDLGRVTYVREGSATANPVKSFSYDSLPGAL